jgi:nickel-dependent lactate racemase
MRVQLPFGRDTLDADVPDSAVVLRPVDIPPLPDEVAAVREALRVPVAGPPLRDLARPGATAAIVISDITRPVPNRVLLPPVIEDLLAGGVREEDITVVNGTGLHRPNTEEELTFMLGSLVDRYRIVQHEARRPETLVAVGRSKGVLVELNRAYVEADIRVVTGFVEPHLFAGYSGGAKGVMPGVAGADIVMSNHGAANLAHPKARWCVTDGNPVFEEMEYVASLCPPSLLLNVTLDTRRRITRVFAGDPHAAHRAAIAHAARQYRVAIRRPFDVVVVTNMGYPADTTLYQSVKGMSVAAEAVLAGGDIVLVAACEEGIGSQDYVEFLTGGDSPAALLADLTASERPRHDQWQVQCQAMVQAKAHVYLYSKLAPERTRSAHLEPVDDLSETVARLVAKARSAGRDGSVLVLPHGQLTVPYVQ